MSKVLIRRLTPDDKGYLRKLPQDTLGGAHGLFVVRTEYTGGPVLRRISSIKAALSEIGKGRAVYHLTAGEFKCECTKYAWNGHDVVVRLKVKVDLEGNGFAKWLANAAGVWDDAGRTIRETSLVALVQTEPRFGLASYVRDCLDDANLELLEENGVVSWPGVVPIPLREKWLSVVEVEEVKCIPHVTAPAPTPTTASSAASASTADSVPLATSIPMGIRPGALLRGQYQILERCGQGGMGQIWKAFDNVSKKEVAVKILREDADGDIAESIMVEAGILDNLSHDNIIGMRGCHKDERENVLFMVMNFVNGQSLEDVLNQRGEGGRLLWEEARAWLRPIAEAIDYVHGKGIVHRDVKPANVMIGKTSPSDAAPRPILCDFGIASRHLNVTQCAWGTEWYRAPEVRPGVEVTFAADVYSFAVTVFRCLTGGLDLPSDLSPATARKVGVPPVVLCGLSRDPSLRPKKCVEFFEPKVSSAAKDMTAAKSADRKVTTELSHARFVLNAEAAKSHTSDDVFLPVKVMDAYRHILAKCGMADVVQRMDSLVKDVKRCGKRMGWRVLGVEAFIDLVSEVSAASLGDLKSRAVNDRRMEIVAWVDNHDGDGEFNAATLAALHAIRDSIVDFSEEN